MHLMKPAAAVSALAAVFAVPMAAQAQSVTGIWHIHMRGAMVKQLQNQLDHTGFHVAETGYFGPMTRRALVSFQRRHHLRVDGIAGPKTERVLAHAAAKTESSASPTFEAPPPKTYRVRAGDTLDLIAKTCHTTWQHLAALNHLPNPSLIRVGEVLRIGPKAKPRTSAQAAQPVMHAAPQGLNQAIVATAMKYLGVPYVWGGSTPAGFDCSGLVQYVLAQNGVSLPRTSSAQYAAVSPIARSQLSPGDLVFFSTTNAGPSHVGIYIGSDPKLGYVQAFIDAPAPGQSVMVQSLTNVYWNAHYYGAGAVKP